MSGVSGAALWEVSCINRSLSALSDVLGALAEQRPHVPYRNSKLTHLLQDAIGDDTQSPTYRYTGISTLKHVHTLFRTAHVQTLNVTNTLYCIQSFHKYLLSTRW